jgi:hypothetical protein
VQFIVAGVLTGALFAVDTEGAAKQEQTVRTTMPIFIVNSSPDTLALKRLR